MILRGPSSRHCTCGYTAPLNDMIHRWRAVGKIVSDLIGRRLNLAPILPETNVLPLDQMGGSICYTFKSPSSRNFCIFLNSFQSVILSV